MWRETQETPLTLDFFTEANLSTQIGTPQRAWGIPVLKEMIDNALDACEASGVSPAITVTVTDDSLTVQDNGPGIPQATLEASLDFTRRVSSNAYYVSPSRGRLGNALKILWGVCAVVGSGDGHACVATGAFSADISIVLDTVLQRPNISINCEGKTAKSGTLFKLAWPNLASSLGHPEYGLVSQMELERLMRAYHVLNPHAAFRLLLPWGDPVAYSSIATVKKWDARDRTPPQWYTAEQFRQLLYATVRSNKSLKTRDFAQVFHRVTASQIKQLEASGMNLKVPIGLLAQDADEVTRLYKALTHSVQPVKPERLGCLGRNHIGTCFAALGIDNPKYHIVRGEHAGVPYVFEVGFGHHDHEDVYRTAIIGMNWSPALDAGLLAPLVTALSRIDAEPHDPVVIVAHLIYPAPTFTDRAKSRLALPGPVACAVQEAVCKAGDGWRKLKAKAEREGQKVYRDAARRARRSQVTVTLKDAVEYVLPEAYEKASGGGVYPVLARQLFYTVRPLVAEIVSRPLVDEYFMNILRCLRIDKPEMFGTWDILSDGRGHGRCPYSRQEIALGTHDVRSVVSSQGASYVPAVQIPKITVAADAVIGNVKDHYSCALYVEKEGFNQLLDETGILRRYGVYLISGKGVPTDAARNLVTTFTECDLPTLVLHDFDYAGLVILKSMIENSDTYIWKTPPYIIDLGLRLVDVEAMGLDSEPCIATKVSANVLDATSITDAEARFLFHHQQYKQTFRGTRVELNAMTTPQLIYFLEQKFEMLELQKPVPDDTLITKLYIESVRAKRIEPKLRAFLDSFKIEEEIIEIPEDLHQRLADWLKGNDEPWYDGIKALAGR